MFRFKAKQGFLRAKPNGHKRKIAKRSKQGQRFATYKGSPFQVKELFLLLNIHEHHTCEDILCTILRGKKIHSLLCRLKINNVMENLNMRLFLAQWTVRLRTVIRMNRDIVEYCYKNTFINRWILTYKNALKETCVNIGLWEYINL